MLGQTPTVRWIWWLKILCSMLQQIAVKTTGSLLFGNSSFGLLKALTIVFTTPNCHGALYSLFRQKWYPQHVIVSLVMKILPCYCSLWWKKVVLFTDTFTKREKKFSLRVESLWQMQIRMTLAFALMRCDRYHWKPKWGIDVLDRFRTVHKHTNEKNMHSKPIEYIGHA